MPAQQERTSVSARQIYQMKVVEILDPAPQIRELVLKTQTPAEFHFRAGQFVMLHVPQGEGKPALRAYSIASDERTKDGFRLIFKYVDQGLASKYVWDLRGGETLQFTGPFGKVFFQEPPTQQIIFLNTGSGISQHLCYLLSKKDQYPDRKYRLFFGVRSEQDIYARAQLSQLADELPDFQFDYVLSRPQESWQGKKGYVQHFLQDLDLKNLSTTFYLCGNGGMIKEAKQIIEAHGIDKSHVWAEAFD